MKLSGLSLLSKQLLCVQSGSLTVPQLTSYQNYEAYRHGARSWSRYGAGGAAVGRFADTIRYADTAYPIFFFGRGGVYPAGERDLIVVAGCFGAKRRNFFNGPGEIVTIDLFVQLPVT